jgi:hypothetical protein
MFNLYYCCGSVSLWVCKDRDPFFFVSCCTFVVMQVKYLSGGSGGIFFFRLSLLSLSMSLVVRDLPLFFPFSKFTGGVVMVG